MSDRPPLDESVLRKLLRRIERALFGSDRYPFDGKDVVDRIYLMKLRRQLRDVILAPPRRRGSQPPAWLEGDQEQLFRMLGEEVRKEIQRTGKKRGAHTAVVRRFSQTHGLTPSEEKSLRVSLHAYLRQQRAGSEE
jgi:hypothetical protein